MRILDKNKLEAAKAQERQQEIDAGLKVAKKIDELREVKAMEEQNLTKLREESLRTIKEQIGPLQEKRDSLKAEILSLEDRRMELRKPLDDEWDRVHALASEVIDRESKVEIKEKEVASSEKLLVRVNDQLKREREALKVSKEAQSALTLEAVSLKNEAQQIKNDALSLRKEFDEYREKIERHIDSKSEELAAKMIGLQNWHNNLTIRQKQQDDRERFINDKYQTLLRSQKRLNGRPNIRNS